MKKKIHKPNKRLRWYEGLRNLQVYNKYQQINESSVIKIDNLKKYIFFLRKFSVNSLNNVKSQIQFFAYDAFILRI